MIRVVLAVLLAAALLGASLPAVESAAETRASNAAERNADSLADAAERLASGSDPSAPGAPGARRTVGIEFPERSLAGDGLAYFAVGGHPNRTLGGDTEGNDALVYRPEGGRTRIVPFPTDLRVGPDAASSADADALVLRDDATLELGYVRTESGPVVSVTRIPRFKSGNGTTPG